MKTFNLILAVLAVASVCAQTAPATGNSTAAVTTKPANATAGEYSKKEDEIHEYELGETKKDQKKHGGSGSEDSHEEYGSKAHGKHAKVGSMDDSHEEYGSKAGTKSKANVTAPTPAPKSGAAGSLASVVGASAVVATAVAASLL